ncbi:double zinc ribbon domain-containing protein [Natronorubrum halophilum]|uniref:double zinc ribbon domain-containing protein n=1 Tax=Natronorubrum halophilum TaxID=1702106 RepID=UPI000EF6E7D2|nr:zinc ribbon domain-containing protein [Natronorubrum halophilum]
MSKITFRADDDLVEQLELLDISKSEAMRDALRSYLAADGPARGTQGAEREGTTAEPSGAIDELVRDRVDELLAARLDELGLESGSRTRGRSRGRSTEEVTVTIALEDDRRTGDRSARRDAENRRDETHTRVTEDGEKTPEPSRADDRESGADEASTECDQCGEHVDDEHVYCPNCGEKASRRLFCECGDEIRSDWAFCPGCGRRTPAADVLGQNSP